MGALAGFIVGYIAGVNAGPQGIEELRKAWQTVAASEEFQGLVESATAFLKNFLAQGSGQVVEHISTLTSGRSELFKIFEDGSRKGISEALHKISETPEVQAFFASGAAFLGNVLNRATTAAERAGQGY
jgi:hypothetical protein